MRLWYRTALILALIVCWCDQQALPANVQTILHQDDYYRTLSQLFSESRDSITIIIDQIQSDLLDVGDPVNSLMGTLSEARKRGVDVRIIFEHTPSLKNERIYQHLLENGITVYFDTGSVLINSRAVVIDSRLCVIGNSQWSSEAARKRSAVSVILHSPAMAREVEDALAKVIATELTSGIEEQPSGTLLPDDFLVVNDYGKRLFKERASDEIDLYLALIKEAQVQGTKTLTVDYEYYGTLLSLEKRFFRGFNDQEERATYHFERVRKILNVLQERYQLIEYDSDAHTVLVRDQFGIDLSKPHTSHPCFVLPHTYWEAHVPHRLKQAAKYVYLIALLEAKKSPTYPYWSDEERRLADFYGVDVHTLSKGLRRLREENIIEIAYIPRSNGETQQRDRRLYRLNRIATDEVFAKAIGSLEEQFGKGVTDKARKQARELNDPKDIFVIEAFIHLIGRYGYEAVRRATINSVHNEHGSSLRHIVTTLTYLENE
jgi:hypothetical protein